MADEGLGWTKGWGGGRVGVEEGWGGGRVGLGWVGEERSVKNREIDDDESTRFGRLRGGGSMRVGMKCVWG